MSRKKEKIRVSILFVIILSGFVLIKPSRINSVTVPFFTLKAITNSGGSRGDLLNFLKQHCARIGIHIEAYTLEWPSFIAEILNPTHDYDIAILGVVEGGEDPDWYELYGEEGSLNIFGYNSSMDWDEDLGTGINEWYLQTGKTIMPYDSEERVHHYWDWQQHMMTEILPCQPCITKKSFAATWSNLEGYSFEDGLLQSWGKMSFIGSHFGQVNPTQLIVSGFDWQNLNPLFGSVYTNWDIVNKILDKVLIFDSKLNSHPHLATDISMINDTHLRLSIREGIKWNQDPDGLFTNEYLDVDDFYFSYYTWKHMSNDKHLLHWIKAIEKVDQYTLDIYIDGDSDTPENEPYAPFMKFLGVHILPEHYLNQTQLVDGVTPDIDHSSWQKFTTDGFGTGLFEIDSHEEGVQTVLSVVNDCWYLDPLVDKSDMDFENRFGDFSGGITKLKVRNIQNRITEITEFELGKVDIVSLRGIGYGKRDELTLNPEFNVYGKVTQNFDFFGYNLRENRVNIGSQEPCEGNSSITIGLAIRKAISYAIDRNEINNVLFRGEFAVTDYPYYEVMGKWCNPNIIRYNHDLDRAREYMKIAGFPTPTPKELNPWEITGIVLVWGIFVGIIVFVFYRTKKK